MTSTSRRPPRPSPSGSTARALAIGHGLQVVGVLPATVHPHCAAAVERAAGPGRSGSSRRAVRGGPSSARPGPPGGRASGDRPSAADAGRTNSSKLTMAETGLPGRPKTGVPPAERPKANGFAGRMATCIHRMVPGHRFSRTTLTMSRSPTLTPPLVTRASQTFSARSKARPSATSSSPTTPRSTASQPSPIDESEEGMAVGVANLSREQRTRSRQQPRRPSRAHRSPGGGTAAIAGMPRLANTPTWAGVTRCPARRPRLRRPRPRLHVEPTHPPVPAWPITTTEPSSSSDEFSSMHTASAPAGSGAPVMIRAAFRADVPRTPTPAMIEPMTRRRAGRPRQLRRRYRPNGARTRPWTSSRTAERARRPRPGHRRHIRVPRRSAPGQGARDRRLRAPLPGLGQGDHAPTSSMSWVQTLQSVPPAHVSRFQIGTERFERLDAVFGGIERFGPVRRRHRPR